MSSNCQNFPRCEKRSRDDERLGHHLDRFLEARLGLLRRDAEAGELVVPIALADAEIEPAAGNQIERRRLLGQQHRIVPGQHDDGGAEPQRGGAHGERGLQHQRGGDLVPAGEMMLDQEARTIAERLGLDGVVEIVAEALPGFRAEVLGAGLRRAEDSELHAASLLENRWRGRGRIIAGQVFRRRYRASTAPICTGCGRPPRARFFVPRKLRRVHELHDLLPVSTAVWCRIDATSLPHASGPISFGVPWPVAYMMPDCSEQEARHARRVDGRA